ncbi:MAG: hypothetical protein WC135_04930 [Bacteroidales bacterium]
MIKQRISRLVIIILLLSSPIIFTQCSAFKSVSKVAGSINNISNMITNYDNMAKHYISVVNKAKTGNISAILEAADLLSNAVDYKKQIDSLLPSMSSSQKKQVSNIESAILAAAKSLIK